MKKLRKQRSRERLQIGAREEREREGKLREMV